MKKSIFGAFVALFFLFAYSSTAYAGVIESKTGIEITVNDDEPKKDKDGKKDKKAEKKATVKAKSSCAKKCIGDKKCESECKTKATTKKKCCGGDKK